MIQPNPKFYSKQKSASQPKTVASAQTRSLNVSPRELFFYKVLFGAFVTALVAGLQLTAWYWGHNGLVFAFTSAIIGLVTGSVFGFEWGLKRGSN